MATIDTVRGVIARIAHCGEQDIVPEMALKDVNADSLHWVQIVVGIEDQFDIEIDFDQMRELTTIQDFIEYIDSCRN